MSQALEDCARAACSTGSIPGLLDGPGRVSLAQLVAAGLVRPVAPSSANP